MSKQCLELGLQYRLNFSTYMLFCELIFGQQTSLAIKPVYKSALSFSPGVCLVLSYVSQCMCRHAPTHVHFPFPLTHSYPTLHNMEKGPLLFHKVFGALLLLYCSMYATLSH